MGAATEPSDKAGDVLKDSIREQQRQYYFGGSEDQVSGKKFQEETDLSSLSPDGKQANSALSFDEPSGASLLDDELALVEQEQHQ